MRTLWSTRVGRIFSLLALVLAIATAAGLAILWPNDEAKVELGPGYAAKSERASVERIEEYKCSGFQTDLCRKVEIELESGPDEGSRTTLTLGTGGLDPDIDVGDALRVVKNVTPPGVQIEQAQAYSLSDFERRAPMLWLALAFVALVLVFGRLRGGLSLAGLAASLAIILAFVIPAILEGEEPVLVALVGSLAVMLVTIPLAHGLGPKSLAAVLGTGGSLLITTLLALLFTELTHLTGLSSEEATILQVNDAGLSLEGLLLAGMVIGALGVLDDVTISQSSTVMALRAANPSFAGRELFARAIEVGRDHVSATVNTLVLAYVGASLPALLVLSSTELGLVEAVNIEVVATEIVAMLVGSIGLIAAVPITTALAAVLAARIEGRELAGTVTHSH
jgi:uncharacterized membrane protein